MPVQNPKGHHYLEFTATPAAILKWGLFALAGVLGGVAGILSIALAQLMLTLGGSESSEKHGISKFQASRLGGVVIVGFVIFSLVWHSTVSGFTTFSDQMGQILLISIAFFCLGLFEDIKGVLKASVRLVLMLLMLTAFLLAFPKFILVTTGISLLDSLLNQMPSVAFLFTVFGLVFFVNAFNTADGANGLISGVSLFTVIGLCQIGVDGLDQMLVMAAIGSAIFMLFNICVGQIFMGDGGAYFLGALIGVALIFVTTQQVVSVWYLLCLVFYPHADLMFSMARRKYNGLSMFGADNGHLHNLLFSRLSVMTKSHLYANSMTGLLIAVIFSGWPLLASNLFNDMNWLLFYGVLWGVYIFLRYICKVHVAN